MDNPARRPATGLGGGGNATLENQVARAQRGDSSALEKVVTDIRDDVYRLALRFLWHPQDAEDATQEILIRVVTRLSTFRGDSAFRTWVYRVASNSLISMKRGRAETVEMSFEQFAEDLAQGLSDEPVDDLDIEKALLLEEVKIGCTTAMLLCLDRPHRIAYALGEIMGLDHRSAASALDITPSNFRKRLSRARSKIVALMSGNCGLFDPQNPCRCTRRVATAVDLGRVDPHQLIFASSREKARLFPQILGEIRSLDKAARAAALYRSHPTATPSIDVVAWLKALLEDREGDPNLWATWS